MEQWTPYETYTGWAILNQQKDVIAQSIAQGRDGGESHARLIAAAPDLLEALKDAVTIFSNPEPDFPKSSTLRRMKIAITKATGQQLTTHNSQPTP